jgi:hypothetical protein
MQALQQHPSVDIQVFVLWVRALANDSVEAADAALSQFRDHRVRHYWEEEDGWSVAGAFRPVVGLGSIDSAEIAWDVYLFYPPNVRWEGTPPVPIDWAHNLRDVPPTEQKRRIEVDLLDRWLVNGVNLA